MLRSDRASTADRAGLQFNGDTGSNYYALANSVNATATWAVTETLAGTSIDSWNIVGDNAPANSFASVEITITYYASTVFHKMAHGYAMMLRGTTTNNVRFANGGGGWVIGTPAAITRIDIIRNRWRERVGKQDR
jgi:hypothetical protein